MKRLIVISSAVVLFLVSTITFASLYGWNDAKRPPMSLSEALVRAEKLLGNDAANRYCVAVSLYGDETGEGKQGAWNLFYAAADGSVKHVFVDMQGKGEVRPWHGPIDWKKNKGNRTDLEDVSRRLTEFFAKAAIAAEMTIKDGNLLVKYHTREFQLYPRLDDGGYAEQLQPMPGPAADGIWMQLHIVNQPDRQGYPYDHGSYWRWERGTYVLTQPGKFLAVDLRYGPNVKYEISNQIRQIFGDSTSGG